MKNDYNFDDLDTNVVRSRLMKGNRRYSPKLFDLSTVPLQPKYPEERVLNPAKVRDLRTLSNYVGAASKAWMEDLVRRQEELQRLGSHTAQSDDEDVGSDSENNQHDYYDLQ